MILKWFIYIAVLATLATLLWMYIGVNKRIDCKTYNFLTVIFFYPLAVSLIVYVYITCNG